MSMPAPTMNDDGLRNTLGVSAILHILVLLFVYFGLPHLMPPLPEHHDPVPLEIVDISELTNTRLKDEEPPKPPQPQPQPAPEPPKQEVKPPAPPPAPTPPTPEVVKPEPQAEALKAAPMPKPKPPEPKPVTQDFNKLLKNLETHKIQPPPTEAKPEVKTQAAQPTSQLSALSNRLSISEEDALRRQIEGCWAIDAGARDAQNMVVDVIIDVNSDKTVLNAEVADKSRYATDGYFRAAAERALRAVRNPRCSPLVLPDGKYDQWKRITFTFDPRDVM